MCCPVGSLIRPPHPSVNWDDVQRLAKWTGVLAEVVAEADASGVAVWLATFGLAETDPCLLGSGVAAIAAGDPLQPVLRMATARPLLSARARQSIAKTSTLNRTVNYAARLGGNAAWLLAIIERVLERGPFSRRPPEG